ncbi:hypothetical protein C8Q74DRAFT_590188 [Fomes fomentarius]|nr:hypothetical protein C8Q74DRAFT_590188 [Fomes fomentarius]
MIQRLHELPIQHMLEVVVGGETSTDKVRKKYRYHSVKRVKRESGLYWRVSDSVDSALEAADCEDLHYLDTASHKAADGDNEKTDTVNDGGIYWKDIPLAREVTKFTEQDRKRSKIAPKELEKRKLGRRSWNHLAVPWEIKYDPCKAPFYFRERDSPINSDEGVDAERDTYEEDEDPDIHADVPYDDVPDMSAASGKVSPYLRNTADGIEALGQVAEYAANVSIHQHRTLSYFVYILRNMCRLLYFDRGGTFISTPFDWTKKETPYLHDFVWKLGRMKKNKAGLGYDPSVSPASTAEQTLFKSMCTDPSVPPEVQQYVKDAYDDRAPLYKVRITTTEVTAGERFPDTPAVEEARSPKARYRKTEVQEFIVGRPLLKAESLIGRCTKGFVALRLKAPKGAKRLCFLKDCWRAYVPGRTRPEHLVYQRLHQHHVKHVATLICGGDVEGPGAQKTMVQGYLHCEDRRKRPVPRVHYRIATEEIGLPLNRFRNFRELALVMADAVRAHFFAWDEAKVLHRDISAGNIMINPTTRGGFLIDWDLSRLECELEVGPVEPDRSGTWISRSALSLKFPRKPYRPCDDIESFVHVYRHFVLRYHPTGTDDFDLAVKQTYERVTIVDGIAIGGHLKLTQLREAQSPFMVKSNPNLQKVLDSLAQGCYKSYARIDLQAMEAKYGLSLNAPPMQVADDVDADDEDGDDEDEDYILKQRYRAMDEELLGSTASLSLPMTSSAPPPSDPCEVTGYLASHFEILRTFKMYKAMPNIPDKGEDQFALPRYSTLQEAPVRQTAADPSIVTHSGTMEGALGSVGCSRDSFAHISGLNSPAVGYSVESFASGVSDNSKKRTREEEVDADVDGGAASQVVTRPKKQRNAKKVVARPKRQSRVKK